MARLNDIIEAAKQGDLNAVIRIAEEDKASQSKRRGKAYKKEKDTLLKRLFK